MKLAIPDHICDVFASNSNHFPPASQVSQEAGEHVKDTYWTPFLVYHKINYNISNENTNQIEQNNHKQCKGNQVLPNIKARLGRYNPYPNWVPTHLHSGCS
jgi:hypothetical protein